MYNSHVHLDADDEPLSYHVEYLGEEHTHNWIAAGKVQLYGSVDEEEQLRAASQIPLVKKVKGCEGHKELTLISRSYRI